MPVFSIHGASARGELSTGLMEGETPDGVAARLLDSGITPIEIGLAKSEGAGDLGAGAAPARLRQAEHVGPGAVLAADVHDHEVRHPAAARDQGPGRFDAQHGAARDARGASCATWKAAATSHGCLARHPKIFPPLYVSIIRVGEETGTLEASFRRLAEYLQQDQDMQDRIKAAMRYPAIVMCVIAAAIGVLTMFVIPKFAPLFRQLGDHIPWPTLAIMGVSSFAQHYWYVVVGALALGVFAARHYVQTEAGRFRWDSLKLRLPVIGKLAHEGIARAHRALAVHLA